MKDSLAAAPTSEAYDAAKQAWEEILSSEKDPKWTEAQKAKEEKFGLYLSSVRAGLVGLVEAEKAAKEGKTGAEQAQALITANHDAISLWLDKKVGLVCLHSKRRADSLSSLAARQHRHRPHHLPRSRRLLGRLVLQVHVGAARRAADNPHPRV